MTLGRPIRTLDWDFVWLSERAFSLPNEAISWDDVSLELPMVMNLLPQLMIKRKRLAHSQKENTSRDVETENMGDPVAALGSLSLAMPEAIAYHLP